jgi:hypothetical protein
MFWTSTSSSTVRRGGAGAAGYDPRMLLGLLITPTATGCGHRVRSSGSVIRTSRFVFYARKTFRSRDDRKVSGAAPRRVR